MFDSVRNLQEWPKWSPWLIAEPDAKLEFADDGNSYAWDGRIIGAGGMILVSGEANESLSYELNFERPWKSRSGVHFSFEEVNEGVRVTWSMKGSLPFFMFWMKNMMKGLIGMDYERGLNMLKDYHEEGEVPCSLTFSGEELFSGFFYQGIKRECSISDLADFMDKDFSDLTKRIEIGELIPTGKPFSIYHKWDVVSKKVQYTIGFPVAEEQTFEGLIGGRIPKCRVFTIVHTGAYKHLGNAWSAGMMRAQNKVFTQNKSIAPFEIYENTPNDVPEKELITKVYFPMK